MPVLLGEFASRYTVLGMPVAQLGVVAYLVAIGFFTPAMLIAFAAAPSLRRVYATFKYPRPLEAPQSCRRASGRSTSSRSRSGTTAASACSSRSA